MLITSKTNKKYKDLVKLKDKKTRDLTGLFVIESKKMLEEAERSAQIECVFLSPANEDYETDKEKLVFDYDLFKKISSLENPDGFGAVIKKNTSKPLSSSRVLLLDGIKDPGNMGTLIRSAEAFAFRDIILTGHTVDPYNEKSLRASMGSIFRSNLIWMTYEDLAQLKADYRLISADMSGTNIEKLEIEDKLILAIGSESQGLSPELRALSDEFVKISMSGSIESLNAAIAGSILMNRLSL